MKLLLLYIVFGLSITADAADIFVAPTGSDTAAGTKEKPVATLSMALRKARELRRLHHPSIQGGIRIIVSGGTYYLEEPLFVRPEDSGTESSPTIIEAADGERPVFSGGVAIRGWTKAGMVEGLPKPAQGKVWVADAPMTGGGLLPFRQLWINNRKGIRTRENDGDSMNRIISWNHQAQTCTIPIGSTGLAAAQGMEMFIHQWWAIAILRIQSVLVQGDSAVLRFHQPESRIQSEHPWPAPWISRKTGNSAFYLTNAIQFLDQPGEWYLDAGRGKVYYYPRRQDELINATVIAPSLETLVKMEGTIDHPVSYVQFRNISFQHTGWLRPSRWGHVPLQAGLFFLDAYKLKIPGTPEKKGLENQAWLGRPAAAVEAAYTSHTRFEGCRFEHLASTALDYKKGTHDDEIAGNLFKDIGGTGIQAGVFSDEAVETHLPYNPADEREVCSNMHIANNLVTDVTNEDWGCVGIAAGFVKGIRIEHNEVSDVSYTGISLGWGWTRTINAMRNNTIHANNIHHYAKHMYDVAGIYTLSAQPGSLISNNCVDSIYKAPYAHDPDHWFYLYTDEGSSYFTVRDNWCPARKFLQNANGPGNTWENNGPQVSDSIKRTAGLQPAYQHLLKEKVIDMARPVNHYQSGASAEKGANPYAAENNPVVMEITGVKNNTEDSLLHLLKQHGVAAHDVYKWKGHLVSFGQLKDTAGIRRSIAAQHPGAKVTIYPSPFYVFNRATCTDTIHAGAWDHVVLTANMVNDPALQKEYLDYHATQYQQWPEVSNGFCHAGFQQLLLFKNGRQLMLIISIPKGSDLDSLNPKTTANNPRADQWNALMKKYQEGIQGTAKGESWVFLKPVSR